MLSNHSPSTAASEGGLSEPKQQSSIAAGDVATDDASEGRKEGLHELRGFAAGVDTGDAECDSVATVLRMLFLSDLRGLQDEVNGIIALAQSSRTEQK